MTISRKSLRNARVVLVVAVVCVAATAFAQSLPGILPAFVTAGPIDPNGKVPGFDGVPGSGVVNLDIAVPLTILTHGTQYVYLVALQDNNFTGTCVVSYKLSQVQSGVRVTLDFHKINSFACGPGTYWAWDRVGKPIPDSPGLATLEGTVTYGTKHASIKTNVLLQ